MVAQSLTFHATFAMTVLVTRWSPRPKVDVSYAPLTRAQCARNATCDCTILVERCASISTILDVKVPDMGMIPGDYVLVTDVLKGEHECVLHLIVINILGKGYIFNLRVCSCRKEDLLKKQRIS